MHKSEICGEVDFSCTNIGYFINPVFALCVYTLYLSSLWDLSTDEYCI